MLQRTGQVIDAKTQQPIPGATVFVYNLDGTYATLTSDGTTALVQPLTVDEFGGYSYYADVGYYREDTWYGGKRRWSEDNIAIGNPGADLNLRADLTESSGSSLVGFLPDGTSATSRTAQAKLRDWVDVRDFGVLANSDGTTGNGADDTAAFQAAVTYANTTGRRLMLPDRGIIRLAAPVVATDGIQIIGSRPSPYKGSLESIAGAARSFGSWLYFDHTGQGLQFDNSSNPISGVELGGFGMFRNQPTPGSGWAPNNHDFDIYLRSAECYLHDLVFLNATKGIKADQGNYGKFSADRICGQFMRVGIQLDEQYDVAQISHFRTWTYWADEANVLAYTRANLDSIYLLRCDNPQMSDIFSINHRSGVRIGQSADITGYPGGTVSKLKVTNLDCDIGLYGLWIDTSVTSGAQIDIGNFSAQCDNFSGSYPVLIQGNNSQVSISDLDLNFANKQAIEIAGTGNVVTLDGRIYINGYDSDAANLCALDVASGNTLLVGEQPQISGGGGTGGSYSGAGIIKTPDWRDWTPTITPATGSFTTVTVAEAKYRRYNGAVDIDLDFTLTSAGSGSGAISVTLPLTSVGHVAMQGYIASGAGAGAVVCVAGQAAATATILKTDGATSAIGAANRIRISGSYRVV